MILLRAERSHSGRVRPLGERISASTADREFESRPLRSVRNPTPTASLNKMKDLVVQEIIEQKIYLLRGQKVFMVCQLIV